MIVDQKPSYNVSKGDSLELMFDVYARPNIVTVELFDSRHQTITIYSSHSLRRINILAHYTTVEVNGTRFILKLTKVLEEYFYKPLKVRFENSKGKASTSVTLYPEGKFCNRVTLLLEGKSNTSLTLFAEGKFHTSVYLLPKCTPNTNIFPSAES